MCSDSCKQPWYILKFENSCPTHISEDFMSQSLFYFTESIFFYFTIVVVRNMWIWSRINSWKTPPQVTASFITPLAPQHSVPSQAGKKSGKSSTESGGKCLILGKPLQRALSLCYHLKPIFLNIYETWSIVKATLAWKTFSAWVLRMESLPFPAALYYENWS